MSAEPLQLREDYKIYPIYSRFFRLLPLQIILKPPFARAKPRALVANIGDWGTVSARGSLA